MDLMFYHPRIGSKQIIINYDLKENNSIQTLEMRVTFYVDGLKWPP